MLTLEFCLLAMTEAGELRTGLVGKLFQFLKVRSQILLRTSKCHAEAWSSFEKLPGELLGINRGFLGRRTVRFQPPQQGGGGVAWQTPAGVQKQKSPGREEKKEKNRSSLWQLMRAEYGR